MKRRVLQKEYDELIKHGRRFFGPLYMVYAMPFEQVVVKPAVKKKIGNATVRNLEKRRIRMILKEASFRKPHLVLAILTKPSQATFLERKQLLLKTIRPLLAA